MFELEDRWYHPDELRELLETHRLVPVEPPDSLAPLLTAYSLDERHGMSEHDVAVIRDRVRERWAAILAAASGGKGPEHG